jgi:hypothetical protein
VLGGLKPATYRLLRRVAEDARVRKPTKVVPTRRVGPNAILIREWGGTRHEVTVLENGAMFRGTRYRSLSQVADGSKGIGAARRSSDRAGSRFRRRSVSAKLDEADFQVFWEAAEALQMAVYVHPFEGRANRTPGPAIFSTFGERIRYCCETEGWKLAPSNFQDFSDTMRPQVVCPIISRVRAP